MELLALCLGGLYLTKGKAKGKKSKHSTINLPKIMSEAIYIIGQLVQMVIQVALMLGKGINILRNKSEQNQKKKQMVTTPITSIVESKAIQLPTNVIDFSQYSKAK